ncbi:unnamed protein product [Oreochromis niloticus]|nr:unnamed protein product [Mustela putorius furo]
MKTAPLLLLLRNSLPVTGFNWFHDVNFIWKCVQQVFRGSSSVYLSCVDDGQTADGWTLKRTRGGPTEDCGAAAASSFGQFSSSSCILSSLTQSDSAAYWCETSSGQSDQINITVTVKGVILLIPALPVWTGSDVTLECSNGKTAAAYFFIKGSPPENNPKPKHILTKSRRVMKVSIPVLLMRMENPPPTTTSPLLLTTFPPSSSSPHSSSSSSLPLYLLVLPVVLVLVGGVVLWRKLRGGRGADLWSCGGDGCLRRSVCLCFSGLFLLTAAGVCVLLLSALTVSTDSQDAPGVEVFERAESVLLPCQVPADVSRSATAAVWDRDELKVPTVHVRLQSGVDLKDQNHRYFSRTSMRVDALSLTLRNPTVSDSGNYTCTTRRAEDDLKKIHVQLKVKVSQHASGVEVYEGAESVLLPCQVSVGVSSSNTAAVWDCVGLSNPTVHLRVQKSDNLDERDDLSGQNDFYQHRTSMRVDALQTGDLSLTLRNPTVSDSGTYTCIYRKEGQDLSQTEVQLKVSEPPPPPPPPPPLPVWPKVLSAMLVTLIIPAAAFGLFVYKTMKDRQGGRGADLWSCGGDGCLRRSVCLCFSGLFLLTAAGVCVLLLSALTVSTAPPLPSESVLRLFCHLVVFCPYCISTGLLLSISWSRKTQNKPVVSMEMSQRDGGGQGLAEDGDDVTADVTTEHAF